MSDSAEMDVAMAGINPRFAGGGWMVEEGPARRGSVVFSFRCPAEWSDEIVAEVERRRLDNPNQLLKVLIREALDRAATGEEADLATELRRAKVAINHALELEQRQQAA